MSEYVREITEDLIQELCEKAVRMRARSYVPYSHFRVGAALLGADGKIYSGCNIENASFTPTICAERTAIFKAVYDGHRDLKAIAICGGKDGVIAGAFPPCGVCRQVMREFCDDDFEILLVSKDGFEAVTLAQLLPHSFRADVHMQG